MALRCQHHDLLPRILRSNIHDGFPVHSHAADAEIIFIVLAGSHNAPPKQQCCNQSIILFMILIVSLIYQTYLSSNGFLSVF